MNASHLTEAPPAPDTTSDTAARYIRSLIYWGELGPGDRLPPATELAAHLRISRVTLRLALKSLESTGYLVTTRGAHGGSRVSDLDALQRCWLRWLEQHRDELGDMFEFRTTIDTRIAELAAERRTKDDVAAMDAALAVEREEHRRSSLFRADARIHRSIAQAAHSPRLAAAMDAVRSELFLPVDQELFDESESTVYDAHAGIIAAVRERDGARAAEAARAHVARVRELIGQAREASGVRFGEPR